MSKHTSSPSLRRASLANRNDVQIILNLVPTISPNQGRVLAPPAPPLQRGELIDIIMAALTILDQEDEEKDMALEDNQCPERL